MRRVILPVFGAAFFSLACSGGSGEVDSPIDPLDGGDDVSVDAIRDVPDPIEENGVDAGPTKPVYDINEPKRKACLYGPGDKTTKTIGPAVPHGDDLPFEHVIVLMLENRSFDHYFSKLPEYGVTDVDVASDDDSNPDPSTGKQVKRYHETRYCVVDTAHNWGPVHLQYDDGLMDGFVMTSNPGGARAMGYYDHTDLPYYYWLSKTFAISDRYFCSMLGPTWPNRFYFWGATSWGRTNTPDTPPLGKPKITDMIKDAGKQWKLYRNGTASLGLMFGATPELIGSPFSDFDGDVRNDRLPELVLIDPNYSGGANGAQDDEHPPANVQKGQKFVKKVIDTLAQNPTVWKKSVLFITYDEHGGFYDHVPPPEACEPDDYQAPDYKFDRLGFRVPVFAISPWTKPGYVSHVVTDHTSITRFIENRWDLPAMTHRDANAWPMLDMFDFSKVSFEKIPTGAPSAEPSKAGLDWCKNNEPGTGLP